MKSLRYKSKGRGFDSRWGLCNFLHSLKPTGRAITLGSTQTLTKMSTKYIFLGVKAAGALGRRPRHLHVPIV